MYDFFLHSSFKKRAILSMPLIKMDLKFNVHCCLDDDKIETYIKAVKHPILNYPKDKASFSAEVICDPNLKPDVIWINWNNKPGDQGYLLIYIPEFMEQGFEFERFISQCKIKKEDLLKSISGQLHNISKLTGHNWDYRVLHEMDGNGLSFVSPSAFENILKGNSNAW